ncbi:hypothetical protein ACFQ1I_24860 [Kitasatospora arboriphila]
MANGLMDSVVPAAKLRAWWAHRQWLTGGPEPAHAGASPAEVLSAAGWARSVGGAAPTWACSPGPGWAGRRWTRRWPPWRCTSCRPPAAAPTSCLLRTTHSAWPPARVPRRARSPPR